MPSLRQIAKPWLRAAGNHLRFPRARLGRSSYLSAGCTLAPSVSIGRDCKIFEAALGHETHLGDEVIVGHRTRLANSNVGHRCVIETDIDISTCTLADAVSIQPKCTLTQAKIGRYSYVAREAWMNDVAIGSFASIGPRTLLGCGDHPTHLPSTSPVFYSTRRQCGASFAAFDHFAERKIITLGHDVWLGARVFVRDGVAIGHGVIVAAGAVVTEDVPPYAIIGGVPAKIIRFRFPSDVVQALLALQWWHWEDARLRAAQPWFAQNDIKAFLREAKP